MKRLTCLALVLIGAGHALASQDPPQYRVRYITPGLDAVNASGMNAFGDVVGTGTTGSGAWISRAGAPAELLPLPAGAQYAVASDINDAGVIVGSVSPPGVAVAWIPDGAGGYTVELLGMLPGHIRSGATAINNVGDIVGSSSTGMFAYPVLFAGAGVVQDLTSTGVFNPKDINDHRVLVDAFARRLDLNTMMVDDPGLPGPGYFAVVGEAINNAGQIAGSAILATTTRCDHQAARHTGGAGWDILSSCGPINSAWDINDRGDVVMQLNVSPYVHFEGIGTFLIEDLIGASVGHWYVINGYGLTINNARQMAVPATNPVTGEGGVVLLTSCYADCDGSGGLDFFDFLCFQNAFAAGDPSADCDASASLDFFDFLCFQNEFAARCD